MVFCANCGTNLGTTLPKFCPNCGAKQQIEDAPGPVGTQRTVKVERYDVEESTGLGGIVSAKTEEDRILNTIMRKHGSTLPSEKHIKAEGLTIKVEGFPIASAESMEIKVNGRRVWRKRDGADETDGKVSTGWKIKALFTTGTATEQHVNVILPKIGFDQTLSVLPADGVFITLAYTAEGLRTKQSHRQS